MITVIKGPSSGGAADAEALPFTPPEGMESETVQDAIEELNEKVSVIDGGAPSND